MGIIDVEAPSALLAVSGADLVLLAVPVSATEATFKAIRHLITSNMLIMDVGSTKRDVVDAARRVLRDHIGAFVPAHPITGKEVSGVEHADPELYAGKQVILTPGAKTQVSHLKRAVELWEGLGCHVQQMAPEAHDAAFAAVSHMPHLLAFALMHAIVNQPMGKDFLGLAGPGFRDFTRIAASDPKMWRDVLLANKLEVVEQAKMFQRSLLNMLQLVEDSQGEKLEGMIELASSSRAHWRMGQKGK
jgi:prephenate dehydrogenase